MTPEQRVEWLARFSTELRRRMPFLSLVAVSQRGQEAFASDYEMNPEEAARSSAETLREGFQDFVRSGQGETLWVRRFAKHLVQLQVALRGANAMAAARRTYPDARDLLPEEAAEIYASARPPLEVGEPGD